MFIIISLILILAIFYYINKKKFIKGVSNALKKDWKIFPLFILALILSYYLGLLFKSINIKYLLTNNNIINILIGTLLGFIFPGPRYIIYAFIPEFINVGFTTTFIVALLFSQQLLTQPDGTVLQVKYFKWKFSIIYSFLMILLIVLITLLMGNLYNLNLNIVKINSISKSQSFIDYLITTLTDLLPILFLAVCFSGVLNEWVDIKSNFKGHTLKIIIISSLLGVLTPGPIYEIYPLMGALKKKGMPLFLITSFITGQASMGPIRALLEVKMLGLSFVIIRLIESLIISILSGLIIKKLYNE